MEPLSEQEAIVAVALSAMYADDLVAPEEDDSIVERLQKSPLFEGKSESALRELFARIERLHRKHGETALLDAAALTLPPSQRAAAWLLAAEVVLSDREVEAHEAKLLTRLATRLTVDEATRRKVLGAHP